jgi:Flp pilus assembly protein TadD
MTRASSLAQHTKAFTLHTSGAPSEAEPFYRAALAIDPDFKEAWMNLGLAAFAQGRASEARACQREALRLDPETPDAHNNLGMIHCTEGHIAEAENCFRAAIRLDPAHPNATLNLGAVRQLHGHVEAAEALFRRALALGADPTRANTNLALALMEQARPEEAEQRCRHALALNPDAPEAHANLALALLTMGRLPEAWPHYEYRWKLESAGAALPQPGWTGQPLYGKTVLLSAEQGFGDTLQFCRYAPMVAAAGGRVILLAPRPLHRLMQSLGGVAELLSEHDPMPPFDYHCPLLSLPLAFGTTLQTIPAPNAYLHADPTPWTGTLGALPGRKIGLVWAGKARTEQPHAAAIDRRRSMRLADMAPLLTVPGCSFVSLQLGPPATQMHALPDPAALHDVSAHLSDWADTAALIMALDLVITVDTAVAHLAGALGKPVWMLNRFDSCWRWFRGRDDTPWYPSMRLFRQTTRGDWASVIQRVRQALTEAG